MPYAVQQDLVDRFGLEELQQLAPGPANGIETAKVARAIDDATALMDGYLRSRYALPLTATPPLLRKFACAIARHDLHQGGDRQPTNQVRAASDEAVRFLKDIADGKADLGLDAALAEPAEASGQVIRRTNAYTGGSPGLSEADLAAYRGQGSLT